MNREENKKYFTLFLRLLVLVLGILVILLINYQIIQGWFGKNGPANLGSIEVSYVSMAKFIRDYGMSSWAPYWYLGFPFHLFYTPLMPFFEVFLHKTLSMPLWETYRLLTAVAYILAPVSVFFLGWQLSKNFVAGLIAGVFYSVGPSIFYFLVPEVAADRFSFEFWDPRRFTVLVRWGEGPHTFSLLFVPLVGVFFARYLEKFKFIDILASAVFLGAGALSNSLGLFAAILLVFSMTFVAGSVNPKNVKKIVFSFFLLGALSLGLISFWYNLSFVFNFFGEGGGSLRLYLSLFPWGWLAGLFLALFLYWIVKKIPKDFGLASSLVWFIILFSVVATYYFSSPSSEAERRVELLPQALRYMIEVDLAFSLLLGVSFAKLTAFLGNKIRALGIITMTIGVIVVVFSLYYIKPFIPYAQKAGREVVNLEKTREYAIASWLNNNVDKKKGERVFVPGNYGFYLNYFSDVWQARGALFQASTHPWTEHIHYQLANGKNPEIAKSWLTIINARYAVITATGSAELYKEMKYLERFEDFPVAYSDSGDIIYKVPLKRESLAKPVNLAALRNLTKPSKADDEKPILNYSDWVENSSSNDLNFEVIDNDNYRISGPVSIGEGILVQMTADSGWRASDVSSGKKVKTGKDPLGFLVLRPEVKDSTGQVDIVLDHRRTWKEWLGYLTTLITFAGVLWYGLLNKRIWPKRSPIASQK